MILNLKTLLVISLQTCRAEGMAENILFNIFILWLKIPGPGGRRHLWKPRSKAENGQDVVASDNALGSQKAAAKFPLRHQLSLHW